eukprot:scaffold15116_cov65-Cylindrotheca_fusiformis.AAC.2
MGKFLRDKDGNLVSVGGAPVLERTLERKTKDCDACGYKRWCRGDKLFILQSPTGSMEWLCPDCAVRRGLPQEHYHRNFHSKTTAAIAAGPCAHTAGYDLIASICQF